MIVGGGDWRTLSKQLTFGELHLRNSHMHATLPGGNHVISDELHEKLHKEHPRPRVATMQDPSINGTSESSKAPNLE